MKSLRDFLIQRALKISTLAKLWIQSYYLLSGLPFRQFLLGCPVLLLLGFYLQG